MPGFYINLTVAINAGQWVIVEEVFVTGGPWTRRLTSDQTINLKHFTSNTPQLFTLATYNFPVNIVINLPEGYNRIEVFAQNGANITWKRM